MSKNELNLSEYSNLAEEHSYVESLESIHGSDAKEFIRVGIDTDNSSRSATFIQKDSSIIHCSKSLDGVEITGIAKALEQYSWLNDYLWKLIPHDKDEITRALNVKPDQGGYFIGIKKGVKAQKPLQTCLHIAKEKFSQKVHNIVVVEEDAELHIIAGCSTSDHLNSGLHIGVSEFYVKKGATLKYTMIHDWGENVYVRPKTAVHVEENGVFISNYISLKPVGSIVANPITTLEKGATARINSILVAGKGTYMDMGSIVQLNGAGARAEIISRAIVAGGTIISRGHLMGNEAGVKGHLECKGLILKDGLLHAIPELSGHTPGVEMSHEAAVGKIDKREIEYLMARGLDEQEAISTIVRGFLNVEIEGLPADLAARIDEAVKETEKDMM
ncbi:MAG: SufD family Fe-S cluster assembly protein [Desulfamplus sp.]|nr:SufD family Fe-S cluster assembly protein [Desulfamplus sp.]MBF0390954.1 SufD family Fe-S cluster assembly protein [Desulfamplus sp.]